MPDSNSPTIFLHIPKTAGTTFHSLLTYLYAGQDSHWTPVGDREGESLRALPTRRRENLDLVRGHVDYGVHKYLPSGAQYITFLRDPVEHARSQYDYYRELCGEDTAWGNPIGDLLRDDSVRLDNQQVRRISGIGNKKEECDHADYERAVKNLASDFAAIGLTERFDESLILMRRLLKWERPLFYRSAKVGTERSEPSDALRKLILDTNQYDQKLYQWAVDWFERAIADSNIQADVESLQRRNRILAPFLDMWRWMRNGFR